MPLTSGPTFYFLSHRRDNHIFQILDRPKPTVMMSHSSTIPQTSQQPPVIIPSILGRRPLPQAQIERNVLLVGPSGGGKSEIINAMKNYGASESRPSRLDPKSVTQDSIFAFPPLNYNLPAGSFTLRLYDTRGLTDSSAR
jgi:hypothetical protein